MRLSIHTHFVLNSVSFETGKKFHINQRDVEELMATSDSICCECGLSVVEPRAKSERAKPMSDREYRSAVNNQSWKIKLEAVISTVMRSAASRENFIDLMEQYGYQVKWTDTRKNITYTTPDGKSCRDSKLHYEKYLKENMEALSHCESVDVHQPEWDKIRAALEEILDLSQPKPSPDLIRKFVSKIFPCGKSNFCWYLNLDGTNSSSLNVSVNGRKNRATVVIDDGEATRMEEVIPLKSLDTSGVMISSSLPAMQHRLL